MIEHFKYEIKPWLFSDKAKELEITINVDGNEHRLQRILSEPEWWESELEYFIRNAHEAFKQTLRQSDTTVNAKPNGIDESKEQ